MEITRSPSYLAWIRTLPCAACCTDQGVQAHHHGRGGTGIKADDLTAVPLCAKHHGEWHQSGAIRTAGLLSRLEVDARLYRVMADCLRRKLQERALKQAAGE